MISEELMQTATARISPDDSRTIWVYLNRQDLWEELVDYFGSEDNVWSTYLRWRH